MESDRCSYRWRLQPVWGFWGHLGLDYTFEDPRATPTDYWLRHVDYGLPGDDTCDGYRWSIALYCAMVARNAGGWPPLRTPLGRLFWTSAFHTAPRAVGEFLRTRLPRFWGPCGAYRTFGPNSNTGLRAAVRMCSAATGHEFASPPVWMRLGAIGWDSWVRLEPHEGPCNGYFESARLRWKTEVIIDKPSAS